MGHKLIRKRITIYSHSIYNVLYLLQLFYLIYNHPNMAARCDMLRYGTGTALGQIIETQAKLGQVEFRFLSQWETGWMAGFEARSLSSESLNPLSLISALFTDSQTETKIIVHETLRSPSYNSTPSISYPHI